MYTICNVIFSLLNILLGWIPLGKLPKLPSGIRDEILSKGICSESRFGRYYVIDSTSRTTDGTFTISKDLWKASRMCGGAFCDPLSGLVVLDKGLFSKNESTLVEALIAHEFGHCFYQGHGEFYWNSCWCYAIREIQADYYAWKVDSRYGKEILRYMDYVPRRSIKDAYLWASMYLFRATVLKILTMIR